MTAEDGERGRRSPTNPMTNPAVAVEMSMRERQALMSVDDWSEQIDLLLSRDAPTDG